MAILENCVFLVTGNILRCRYMTRRSAASSGIIRVEETFVNGLNPSFPDWPGTELTFDATDSYTPKCAIGASKENRGTWKIAGNLVLQLIGFADRAGLGPIAAYAIADLSMSETQFAFFGNTFDFLYVVLADSGGILAIKFSVVRIILLKRLFWDVVLFSGAHWRENRGSCKEAV